ncbi:Fur family transcriptional regulator [Nocardia sp.]|uniref:Fur family transcriptional regulator n=1 Tax=Nocardia sp. TaxID=1821 RepID=UPI0026071F2F|nr:Fur family transcriptional regulator [Nocardia sp.]
MTGAGHQIGAVGSGTAPGHHEDRVRRLLREHGLRCTTPRLAVLSVLDIDPPVGHLSAGQIHRRLAEQGREVDVTTVYRTVSTLVEVGVLHALTLDEHVTTYGLADHPHHHAICTRCATMIEVPADRLSTALAQASLGSSFALSEHAGLTLHGLCPDCQQAHDATAGVH